jgi:cytochrome c peroxidase
VLLPEPLPPSPGNAVADSDAAAALGMRIFFDNRFSQPGSGVACSSCHDPDHAFAERKRTSHTIGEVLRNAPDLLNAARYRSAHFWDGKVDNLWSAPLFTFEQESEMGATRLGVAHTLSALYKARYEKTFGPLPNMADTTRFPPSGKPGMPAFEQMSSEDQEAINRVYVNVGKALEAYMRKLAAGRAAFDDFLLGAERSLGPGARRGVLAFSRLGCDGCHSGPMFTDEGYHDFSLAGPGDGRPRDPARAAGRLMAGTWPFTSASHFADEAGATKSHAAVLPTVATADDPQGFRTPSLRNVAATAPYFHDGAFDTLAAAIDAHAPVLPERAPPNLQDRNDIIEFMLALSGRRPSPPWNYWPGG